jgi:hypothetical protein
MSTPPTGLDHDNSRSLKDIAASLRDLLKQNEERRATEYDLADMMPGIAESLAEISQNTARIASALEGLLHHLTVTGRHTV